MPKNKGEGLYWLKFYPDKWTSDLELQDCSLAAQGLLINLMCYAFPDGKICNYDTVMTKLRRRLHIRSTKFEHLMNELRTNLRIVVDEKEQVLTVPRMDRDWSKLLVDKENGSKGGRPKEARGGNPPDKQGANTEIEIEKEVERERERVNPLPLPDDLLSITGIDNQPPANKLTEAFIFYFSSAWRADKQEIVDHFFDHIKGKPDLEKCLMEYISKNPDKLPKDTSFRKLTMAFDKWFDKKNSAELKKEEYMKKVAASEAAIQRNIEKYGANI